MNVVLDWVKKNVFIVVFIVLMIAALAVIPYFASRLNADVQENVKSRARKASEMSSLATDLSGIPGLQATDVIVNERLLEQYERAANAISEDASQVVAAAVQHNRKGRGVLMPRLLPEPPMELREVLPPQFHDRLIAEYVSLLADVQAGWPPDEETIQQGLDRVEAQIRAQVFFKGATDPLEPDELAELQEKLAAERLALYGEAAAGILFYASLDSLAPPGFNRQSPPTLTEMYHWQWQYWITEDVLRAFHAANESDRTVLAGPVKRVLRVQPWEMPYGSGGSEGRGSRRGRSEDGPAATTADPRKPVPTDFTVSFTGRRTNPLYDVQMISIDVIVDSNRIPEVIDALGAQNFMTVTNLTIRPADPYTDVEDGHLYGRVPVSILSLEVETIWLREWTTQFMPTELKEGLGIRVEQDRTG